MARRWTQWRETYGDFTLERPLSAAMKAFVAKMNADDDLDLSEAETVRDQDAGAALHPPRRVPSHISYYLHRHCGERWAALRRTNHGPEENIMTTLSAWVIFAEDYAGTRTAAAAEALRAAGYQAYRLPPALAAQIEIAGDDFIEARIEGDDDTESLNAMWADVERVVAPFDADVDNVGPAAKEPFDGLMS